MTTILRARAAALLMLITAAPSAAQDVLHYRAGTIEAQQPGISVVAVDPISVGEPVRDAPYSAEAITEMTQHLADGNRIERRTTATIARSSDGRTRREQQGFAFGGFIGQSPQPIVTITDPATGMHITLNYELKVAFRMKPGRFASKRLEGGTAARRVMPPPPAPPEVFFEAPLIATAPIAAEPAMAWNGETKTESLEPRVIDGLRADGTRVTLTIPAGAVGNALPIEVVSERWFSPELRILLMTRRSDPRFGDTVYRLTNIVRGEPAAELFRVPADFRIEDMTP